MKIKGWINIHKTKKGFYQSSTQLYKTEDEALPYIDQRHVGLEYIETTEVEFEVGKKKAKQEKLYGIDGFKEDSDGNLFPEIYDLISEYIERLLDRGLETDGRSVTVDVHKRDAVKPDGDWAGDIYDTMVEKFYETIYADPNGDFPDQPKDGEIKKLCEKFVKDFCALCESWHCEPTGEKITVNLEEWFKKR